MKTKQRNAKDWDVDTTVRSYCYPWQEGEIMEATETWSEGDYLFAVDRIPIIHSQQEIQEPLRSLYLRLLKARKDENTRAASELLETQRHNDIAKRLDELKRPHWSVIPNFWLTVFILILTAAGVVVGILTLRH
jgi:hypothetical protein